MRKGWCGLPILLCFWQGAAQSADLEVFPLHSQANVALLYGRSIYVEVKSGRIENYLASPTQVEPGTRFPVQVEWERLSPALQAMALRRLFPADTVSSEAWIHRVAYGETLEDIALWWTGTKDGSQRLADYNALASTLRQGQEIKIPKQFLSPALAAGLPSQRRTFVARLAPEPPRQTRPAQPALGREDSRQAGAVLILDAGHGGEDPGALGVCGLSEDEYVYDVAVRVGRLFEKKGLGKVFYTVRDKSQGTAPRNRRKLKMDKTEFLLTTPRYYPSDTKVSAHLRWYLANSIVRRQLEAGVQRDKIIFTSFHADSRDASASGLMAYYPYAALSKGSVRKGGKEYQKFKEVREEPRVSLSKEERTQAERMSKKLAKLVVRKMRENGVRVHPDQPVRGSIIREQKEWIPAILRYNEAPIKLLVEVANVGSETGCKALMDPNYRQRIAEAYVEAVAEYAGLTPEDPSLVASR